MSGKTDIEMSYQHNTVTLLEDLDISSIEVVNEDNDNNVSELEILYQRLNNFEAEYYNVRDQMYRLKKSTKVFHAKLLADIRINLIDKLDNFLKLSNTKINRHDYIISNFKKQIDIMTDENIRLHQHIQILEKDNIEIKNRMQSIEETNKKLLDEITNINRKKFMLLS